MLGLEPWGSTSTEKDDLGVPSPRPARRAAPSFGASEALSPTTLPLAKACSDEATGDGHFA
jgi:hypothetical protein